MFYHPLPMPTPYSDLKMGGLLLLSIFTLILPGARADQTDPGAGTSEEHPVPEYRHAPDSAVEAFNDLKYGIRIHWGIYTSEKARGYKGRGESWIFQGLNYQEKQDYQQLYKQWNPTKFNADDWCELFADNGMKMFAITTKHHEGFSLFDTRTKVKRRVNWTAPGGPALEDCDLAYSVMDTPFHRDIIKELCDAGHKYHLAIDLYFSHPDWYDADFRPYTNDPLSTPSAPQRNSNYGFVAPERTPEETSRMMARHREQLTELLTNYGKIDMVCLDMSLGNDAWPKMRVGNDIWPRLRETMLQLRKIQPEAMFRDRGIGQYGDYNTPERAIPTAGNKLRMPWFAIYPLAKDFDYDDNVADYKGGPWIIRSLIDSVAKGGNFMVGIGPDASGRFHPQAVENIRTAGAWLKINGEGVYATRPREGDLWHEDNEIRYTQSKDRQTIYAFSLHWPGKTLALKTVQPKADSSIMLFGYDKPLSWSYSADSGTVIQMPDDLQDPGKQTNFFACGFRIQVKP